MKRCDVCFVLLITVGTVLSILVHPYAFGIFAILAICVPRPLYE